MKNLNEEKTDKLPKSESYHIHGLMTSDRWSFRVRRLESFPYKRVKRFLRSQVGLNWNLVTSKYVKLDWVPKEFRRASKLINLVETNTSIIDGKVAFYNDQIFVTDKFKFIEDEREAVLYVHPNTGNLAFKAQDKQEKYVPFKNANLIVLGELNQLIRLGGVWYHVYVNPKDTIDCRGVFPNSTVRPLLEEGHKDLKISASDCFVAPIQKKQLSSEQLRIHGLKNNI